MTTDRASFWLTTPPPPAAHGGAIAAIDLMAPSSEVLQQAMLSLGLAPLAPGAVALRSLGGVDTGLVARWSGRDATLFPHAGAAVLAGVRAWLLGAGLTDGPAASPRTAYPEASDDIEACALDAIARADSPLAIDAVLLHAERRRSGEAPVTPERQRTLDHLLRAPVVVLVGAPNIGKSALTNAMARRAVSIVADEPGTTRDAVGVMLDLAGLRVRWIDAPGIRATGDAIEARAQANAQRIIAGADLLLLCADHLAPVPDLGASVSARALRVTTRADLATTSRAGPGAVRTSALTGEGLGELAKAVRDALVPDEAITAPGAWRFHGALGSADLSEVASGATLIDPKQSAPRAGRPHRKSAHGRPSTED